MPTNYSTITDTFVDALDNPVTTQRSVYVAALSVPLFVQGTLWNEAAGGAVIAPISATGTWSVNLPYPAICDPASVKFSIALPDGETWSGVVPAAPGPFTLHDLKATYSWSPSTTTITPTPSVVTGITAGDGTIIIGGTSVQPTVRVGTVPFTDISGVASDAQLPADIPYTDVANTFTATQIGPFEDKGGAVYNVKAYGLLGDNSTDNSAAMATLLTTVYNAGGGQIYFPQGTYRFLSAITPPTDGASPPNGSPSIRLFGAGSYANGYWVAGSHGASILDLRYASTGPAKIDTRGSGVLEIDHLTLISGGTDNVAFIQTTNTTLRVHDCAFYGNPANSGTTCVHDAIILGSTTTTIDGSATAAFQGYGTVIRDNFFSNIRRGVVGRTFCNAVPIYGNTFSTTCGNSAGGAIEFTPLAGQYCTGNMVERNLVEVVNYQYLVNGDYMANCVLGPNGAYDPTATTLGTYNFGANCTANLVIDGYRNDTKPLVTETGAAIGTTTALTGGSNQTSIFSQTVKIATLTGTGPATFTAPAGVTPLTVQRSNADDSGYLFSILRSAADAANPGTLIAGMAASGALFTAGPTPTLFWQDQTGAATGQIRPALWQNGTGGGSGGGMVIDSGSGGSYVDVKAYTFRVLSYSDGAITFAAQGLAGAVNHLQTTGTGTGSPPILAAVGSDANIALNLTGKGTQGVQIAGAAALLSGTGAPSNTNGNNGDLYLRVDGGAGTTIYQKRAGAWVATAA